MREFWSKVCKVTKKICKSIADRKMWCTVGSFCLRFLSVPVGVLILLTIITVVALCYVFINRIEASPLAYVAYAVSAYTFVAICVRIPRLVRTAKDAMDKSERISYIRNHHITKRLVNDKLYRGRVVLYKGLITSMLFAAFKMTVAIVYHSVWFGAVAVYYLALSGMRYLLVRYMRKADNIPQNDNEAIDIANGRYLIENRGYRMCGYLMFFLNVAMSGMTIQMVLHDKGYTYPGFIIYVSAMYAFYTLVMSIINLVKYRKLNSPVISAAKIIGLASALMSILALQTAMLTQFGDKQYDFIRLMNTLTGTAVCLSIFIMAIIMIYKSGKQMKRLVSDLDDTTMFSEES